MNESAHLIVKPASGLPGRALTIAELPLPDTKRWVIRRKAVVVAAIRGGVLSLEDACNRYALSAEEFQSWQSCLAQFGLAGLRVTRIQSYARRRRRTQRFEAVETRQASPSRLG